MTLLNFLGLKLVGWTSIVLVVACLLPFVVFIIMGIPHVDTRSTHTHTPFKSCTRAALHGWG